MNARQIASLALKLMGIFILVRYIQYLPMILGAFSMISMKEPLRLENLVGIAIAAGTPLLYLIACLLIVIKSDTIAKRLVTDEQARISTSMDADTMQTLAFCIVGLVLLTGAIPRLAQLATNYFMLKRMPDQRISYMPYGDLIAAAIQLVLGLVLFLQADGLVGLWKKLRETKGIIKT